MQTFRGANQEYALFISIVLTALLILYSIKIKKGEIRLEDILKEIQEKLFSLCDEKYRDFNSSLIPNIDKALFIGVRSKLLRDIAKKLWKSGRSGDFLSELPHKYFEENLIHGYIISLENSFDNALAETEKFLPYIDNWAVCDLFSPKVFSENKKKLSEKVKKWLNSDRVYTVRFGINMLMTHFLGEDFEKWQMDAVVSIRSSEYYVKTAQAWYVATALTKQYEAALPVITEKRLDRETHNKAIQKAVESRAISDETKKLLRTYKIKGYVLKNN